MASTIKVTSLSAPNTQTGTTYTLAIGDEITGVTFNNTSTIAITIPLNSSIAFPIGSQILLAAIGSGQVTVTATSGVTLNSASGLVKLRTQYSPATLWKTATDTWLLLGDLAA